MGDLHRRERRTLRSVAPFVGASVLAWAAVPIGSTVDWVQYAIAIALALVAGAMTVQVMRGRLRHGVVPSALVFLAAVGLLRNSAGGIPSGASTLSIIPVFCAALYSRSRRDLLWILGAMALFYLVPIVFVGGAGYPTSQYRAAALVLTVSSIIGWATQRLVGRVRAQASESRGRERMLERITETVHRLFDSPTPRADVCHAAVEIGEATVALIYEPRPDGALVCTAMTGLDAGDREIVAERTGVVQDAFATGQATLIDADAEKRVGSVDLWRAAGSPVSVLYQPLRRGGMTLGVLAVGWTDQVRADGPRGTVIALLAHEAAAVIARADALDELAGEALTDPLTGLPNRRAWDSELARALASDRPVAVAMLDLDHFKQFNDAYGHPAGDRLLKETAAAWRDHLRTGDLLARLGGEEFGLLLHDCASSATAVEVVERLRIAVAHDQTCSAGIAARLRGDAADSLVARADAALYEAKATGRDRSYLSAGAGAVLLD